jgi:hypothetical protein
MRRIAPPTFLSLVLLLGAAGCGGGGGGGAEEAYCEAAEDVADESLTGEEAADAIADLADEAPADLEEQFELLDDVADAIGDADVDAIADFDEDDVEDAVDDIDDFTEEECDVELALNVDISDPESFADEEDDDETEATTQTTAEQAAGEFDDLIVACEDGDLAACDELFRVTPVGSPEEEIGLTCGGRVPLDEAVGNTCVETLGDGGDSGTSSDTDFFSATVQPDPLSDGDWSGSVFCDGDEASNGGPTISGIDMLLLDDQSGNDLAFAASVSFEPVIEGNVFLETETDVLGSGPITISFDDVPGPGDDRTFVFVGSVALDDGSTVEVAGEGACIIN